MKKLAAAALVCATVLNIGCAAMFNGASQAVNIRSNEECMGKGQAVYTFKKKQNYVIKAEKEGCRTASITPTKSFDPTRLLGILIDWGIVSVLIVDGAATGAWAKFDQTSYVINPECS